MNKKTTINHVALQCFDKEKAEIFFNKILGFSKLKSFTLSEELSESIFGIRRSVEIDVYDNGVTRFEVFIDQASKSRYEHTCIEVINKKEFMARCKKYGLEPLIVKKGDKDLLFVKDFSNNLYEVKEK